MSSFFVLMGLAGAVLCSEAIVERSVITFGGAGDVCELISGLGYQPGEHGTVTDAPSSVTRVTCPVRSPAPPGFL